MAADPCLEVRALLSEERDGELPQELRRRVLVHVASCGSCEAHRKEIRRVGDGVKALAVGTPSMTLGRDVRGARMERRPPRAPAAPIVAALFIGLAGGLVLARFAAPAGVEPAGAPPVTRDVAAPVAVTHDPPVPPDAPAEAPRLRATFHDPGDPLPGPPASAPGVNALAGHGRD